MQTEKKHEIRKADLSIPYYDTDCKWSVDEQLYPENRGHVVHQFKTEIEAHNFIAGAK